MFLSRTPCPFTAFCLSTFYTVCSVYTFLLNRVSFYVLCFKALATLKRKTPVLAVLEKSGVCLLTTRLDFWALCCWAVTQGDREKSAGAKKKEVLKQNICIKSAHDGSPPLINFVPKHQDKESRVLYVFPKSTSVYRAELSIHPSTHPSSYWATIVCLSQRPDL